MGAHEQRQPYPRSHLFTVRLWMEAFDDGQREVRIQVKHVMSGETRYFREWTTLLTYLDDTIRRLESQEGGPGMAHHQDT